MMMRTRGATVARVLVGFALALGTVPVAAWAERVRFPFGEAARLFGTADALPDQGEAFGTSVAADGDTIVVGAPGHAGPSHPTGAAYVFVRAAGVWTRQASLVPAGGIATFGSSVGISGDTVVVGAPSSGRVFVYVRTGATWIEQAQLGSSDDGFGASVSISRDTLAVGAPRAAAGIGYAAGTVHVFVRTGVEWAETQTLVPEDAATGRAFGESVSVSGDSLVAGAPGDRTYPVRVGRGAAYVFARSGGAWAQQARLTSAGEAAAFGTSVAMDGDNLAVGAPEELVPGPNYGAAYVFVRGGSSWPLQQRIEGSSPSQIPAKFGTTVALDRDTLLVGAPGEVHDEIGAVRVYVRQGISWSLAQTLGSGAPAFVAGYGRAVAVAGDAVFAGAPYHDESSGFVRAYRRSGSAWGEESWLVAPGTTKGERFGASIALEGETLAVGAPWDDLPFGRFQGSVYVFVRNHGAWTLQQKVTMPGYSVAFGSAVALSGDTLAASALGASEHLIYVFVRVGGAWELQASLSAPSGTYDSAATVALDGNTLVVGTPLDDEGGADAGAGYVFVRSGVEWSRQQKLVATLPVAAAEAGRAVAIQGDTAFLGAPGDGAGRVFVFRRASGSWVQQSTLAPADETDVGAFGAAVAVSDGTLFVGAPHTSTSSGTAYVFEEANGSWQERQTLVGSLEAQFRELGRAVAVSGDLGVVATTTDLLPFGGIYFFRRARGTSTWSEEQLILSWPTHYEGEAFGTAVAVSGAIVAVGAVAASTPAGFHSGAAYVFRPALADLSISISGAPATVRQGDPATFTLMVSNGGPTGAPDVQAEGTLSPGFAVESVSSSQGVCRTTLTGASCELGSIYAGQTATVTIVGVGAAAGAQTVGAAVTHAGGDPAPGNNSATTTMTVDGRWVADVAVTTRSSRPVAVAGQPLGHEISVENRGPDPAIGVVLDDATPKGLTLLGVGGSCQSLPCLFPRIEPYERRFVGLAFTVPLDYEGPDPVVNTARVSAGTFDPNPFDDISTLETPFSFPSPATSLYTIPACRLFDTRDPALGGPEPLEARAVRQVPDLTRCEIPFFAAAVVVNVTVTEATASGNLKLYAAGTPVPSASTINYGPGQTRSNEAIVGLAISEYAHGFWIKAAQGSGTVHVVIDVFGFLGWDLPGSRGHPSGLTR